LELIQRSTDFLMRKGVDSPRLQVELLLGHVLRMPRLQLYLQYDRELTPSEMDPLRELVRRRGDREPIQHLTGSTSFCGWEIEVTPAVLVPRPETERLAEIAVDLIGANGEGSHCLDFGTGSGCLAVAIAAQCPTLQVDAVDVSAAAVAVARRNLARHGLSGRVTVYEGDGFSPLPAERRYGLIVSNPPYIPTGDIPGLEPEVRNFDPRGALDGGEDGLKYYRRLAMEASGRLENGGRLALELGDGQEMAVSEIFRGHNWIVERVERDYNGTPRVWVGRR
jgi:release factor glutamine methyltransferase